MLHLAIYFVVIIQTVLTLEVGELCVTPNGEQGTCKTLETCVLFKDKVMNLNEEAFQFTLISICGNTTTPLVCCGSYVSMVPEALDELKPMKNKLLPHPSLCGLQMNQKLLKPSEVVIPWVAALRYIQSDKTDAGFKCRGTLINKRYVLTAAQCLLKDGFQLYEVRLGMWKASSTAQCTGSACSKLKNYGVEEVILHPDYNKRYSLHDIGLIRLNEDVSYDENIRPICLPPNRNLVPTSNEKLQTAGWVTGTRVDLQVQQPLDIVEDDKCTNAAVNVTRLVVCPSHIEHKYPCEVVTGTPIMRKYPKEVDENEEQWYQEGIIFADRSCKHRRVSGSYLQVSKYLLWVLNNLR
ncbi:hypothetical protein FQA39_LY02466 [Lamprigera yunnana]|nr:hypothetical protein FQA39_LY02466 [Lamprigera yunnana]